MEGLLCVLPNDIVADILSRLPSKHLSAFKCTCRRWCRFVSDPEFALIYALKNITCGYPMGLFTQELLYCCDRMCHVPHYICLDKKVPSDSLLDFLTERTALVSLSNGILCCRNLITSFRCYKGNIENSRYAILKADDYPLRPQLIYICNPATREWFTVNPPRGFNYGKKFAFSFDPHSLSFTIVAIQQSRKNPNGYSFVFYNSRRKTWRASKEYDLFAFEDIRQQQHVFLNGRCYWLTRKSHMLVVDVETQSCQVIEVPRISLSQEPFRWRKSCLGVSDGNIHYTYAYKNELKTWMLTDNHNSEPLLQWIPVVMFTEIFEKLKYLWNSFSLALTAREKEAEALYYSQPELQPLHLYNNVLFLEMRTKVVSYNQISGEAHYLGVDTGDVFDFVFLPYCPTIISLKLLGGSPVRRCDSSTPTKRRKLASTRKSKSISWMKRK